MAEPPLRTVLVGAAHEGAGFAELLAAHPGYDLVGVAEDDDARAIADVAVICAEPARQAALAERLLGLGLHVLAGDLPAGDVPAARRVVEAARAAGRTCAVVSRVLAPPVRRLRHWVDAGRLGLPRSVDVELLAGGAGDPGGALTLLRHPIDEIRAVTGCEPVEVFAEAGTLRTGVHPPPGADDADDAVVSALFTHGLVASILVGRVPAAPGAGASTIRLIGSHGHVEVDAGAPAVHRYSAAGVEPIPIDPPPVAAVLDDFRAGIRAGRPPGYDCTDAAIAAAAVDAARRSLASGSPEPVGTGPAATTTHPIREEDPP